MCDNSSPQSALVRPTGRRPALAFFVLASLALITMLVCPFIGISHLGLDVLFGGSASELDIFWKIRLPRVCLAFMVGASLAVCGLTFQAMFRNVLATPYTLGVASGAAFGAAVALKFGVAGSFFSVSLTTALALGGALLTLVLILALASPARGYSPMAMLLAGVVISYFFSSLVLLLQYLGNFSEVFQITRWLMGTLEVVGFQSLKALALLAALGISVVFILSRALDLMILGDELALSRGLNASQARLILFLATSLVVGAVVAVCGPIAFVGLIVPYISREIFRNWSHRLLLPAVLLLGGVFLTWCDTFARVIVAPFEIPVGVVTALLGGPFFLWLLLRGGRMAARIS